jgi:membrane dipeptidase
MFLVDAHLDLAYNAVCTGRDVTLPAVQQAVTNVNEIPTVGLPDLRAGQVRLICATIFAQPQTEKHAGYTDADSARAAALEQLRWYQGQEAEGRMTFVRSSSELPSQPSKTTQHAILLMEGADPLRSPADLPEWFAAGMRILGLAWRGTRYAGGTGVPGPLTAEGVAIVPELDRLGIIHDASHLAEESFWQLLDLTGGPIMASHSNCRAIVPTDRQLSDDMIRALVKRGGVVGINFYDKFLLPPDQYQKRRATLADLVAHVQRICDLAGSAQHVGIGTDLDGGLGRDQIPREITTAADLPRVADGLAAANFDDEAITGILGGNWLRFFRKHLARG